MDHFLLEVVFIFSSIYLLVVPSRGGPHSFEKNWEMSILKSVNEQLPDVVTFLLNNYNALCRFFAHKDYTI
jgi:hypothetical protein